MPLICLVAYFGRMPLLINNAERGHVDVLAGACDSIGRRPPRFIRQHMISPTRCSGNSREADQCPNKQCSLAPLEPLYRLLDTAAWKASKTRHNQAPSCLSPSTSLRHQPLSTQDQQYCTTTVIDARSLYSRTSSSLCQRYTVLYRKHPHQRTPTSNSSQKAPTATMLRKRQ